MPYLLRLGFLPISLWATLCWNPPNTLPIRGVIIHVSNPYNNTNWTTANYIWTKVRSSAPSLPINLISCSHFRLAFRTFLTTAGQSPSAAMIICPRYLKEVTRARVVPYAVIYISTPALASSSVRQRRFLSAPLWQKSDVMCRPLRALCDTNISQWGPLGWGWFPSSGITIVFRAWLCLK